MAQRMTAYQWQHTPAEKRPADAHIEPVPLGQLVMTRVHARHAPPASPATGRC